MSDKVDALQCRVANLEERNKELVSEQSKLLQCLCDIQGSCIGEVVMGHRLDAMHIGSEISEVTGLTHPALVSLLAKGDSK